MTASTCYHCSGHFTSLYLIIEVGVLRQQVSVGKVDSIIFKFAIETLQVFRGKSGLLSLETNDGWGLS